MSAVPVKALLEASVKALVQPNSDLIQEEWDISLVSGSAARLVNRLWMEAARSDDPTRELTDSVTNAAPTFRALLIAFRAGLDAQA